MKILIAGGSGQLGSDCLQVLRKSFEVMAVGSKEMDITRLPEVEGVVRKFSPDIIINCAAYTRVDACETERKRCWNINVNGPANLALCMEKHRGRIIHISSDYVFDGERSLPDPYVEDDVPHPLSVYGKTKLEGELSVMRETDRYIILRTAWLYGIAGQNFLGTMLKLALQNPEKAIPVVNDQFGSPTWSFRLATQISKLIEENEQGIYHATSEGVCTWYELACYFLEKMGVSHTVIPCTSKEYPVSAVRPKNSVLENRHLKEKDIHLMKHWQTDLNQYISEFGDRLIEQQGG